MNTTARTSTTANATIAAVTPYRVTRGRREWIEYATSSGAAALAVMQRHNFFGAAAKPVTVQ